MGTLTLPANGVTAGSEMLMYLAVLGVLAFVALAMKHSRRVRLAAARAAHPAGKLRGRHHADRAAAAVEAQHGLTAWIQCVLCRRRELRTGLTPAELVDALTDPRVTCSRCVDVLDATAKDVAA
ncbi:hypothetical protein [Intrasporangium flavum]|uniref:hypothetical protein n=1 Tax=Intrasporangium flavum TaxID=1428657 RepID=UPI00096D230E|nr:hypothetical protein [Intrasporangium flavum]